MRRPLIVPASLLAAALVPGSAAAQEGPPEPDAPPATPTFTFPAGALPGAAVGGALPPAGFDPNAHLPSSSRAVTDIGAGDRFDLGQRGSPAASVRGSAGGAYVPEAQTMPEAHPVQRGDTLWELSSRYFRNPYEWPRLWSYNPQLQNPHWIYPGDRVRLREAGQSGPRMFLGVQRTRAAVPPQTIFLRETGWIDDAKNDTWGAIVGAPGDKMFLSQGDDFYAQLQPEHEVALGDLLAIFTTIRSIDLDGGAGELVAVRGTARIDRYNPDSKMVRARIIEALSEIERGAKIGPVGRRFDVVPPIASDLELEAQIIASLYPHEMYGQHQVVFVDKGEKDGVRPGQRFFAISRGDPWAQAIRGAGPLARQRPRLEDDRPDKTDELDVKPDESLMPDETYAELRVLRVRPKTSAALVIAAKREVPRGARLVARKGF